MPVKPRLFAVFLVLAAVGAGCTGGGFLSPEVDRSGGRVSGHQQRTVVRGDTLYSIAWDVSVDFRTLALWNKISPPYVIKPGQRLRIIPPTAVSSAPAPKPAPAPKYHRVRKGDTLYSIARRTSHSARQLASWNGLRAPYLIRPGQRLRLSAPSQRPTAGMSKSRPSTTAARKSVRRSQRVARARSKIRNWSWPANGKILRRFRPQGASKGVDIGGRRGLAIRAAAAGLVVYQGSGLRGYGRLIIIKHNADFLSAYAHSARILVKEGTVVKKGERIAIMGSSGTDRVKLHFEIRYRGNPVNPLRYLPKR